MEDLYRELGRARAGDLLRDAARARLVRAARRTARHAVAAEPGTAGAPAYWCRRAAAAGRS